MNHALYDKRKYPIVDVREGYGEWVHTYEQVVQDEMDVRLLERLRTVDWAAPREALDLACGTGRIGVWLKARSAAALDGIDLTPEMLELARAKGVYRSLAVAVLLIGSERCHSDRSGRRLLERCVHAARHKVA